MDGISLEKPNEDPILKFNKRHHRKNKQFIIPRSY